MVAVRFMTFLVAMLFIVAGGAAQSASAADPSHSLAGAWVDKTNAKNTMVLSYREGLLRLKAGESYGNGDAFSYQAACAPEMDGKPYLNCVGFGGKLNGADFIYSSQLQRNSDGSLSETWFAENGDRVSGKTVWVPAKPSGVDSRAKAP